MKASRNSGGVAANRRAKGARHDAPKLTSPRVAGSPEVLRYWIAHHAGRNPDKAFVHSIEQNKTLTYSQLHEVTIRLAGYLERAGVGANDRVALLSNNSIEHLATYLGVMAYGATVCTINVEMNAAYFEEILNGLAPRLVLFEKGVGFEHLVDQTTGKWSALGDWQPDGGGEGLFAELAGSEAADVSETSAGRNDDACIFFTSGTSAKPKGVILSFGELLDNVEPIADAFGITVDDRVLDFRSYNWASAQIQSCLAPLSRGATVVMARKFSQSRFFGWVQEHRATITAGNPTTISMLMNLTADITAADMPTLRFVTSSSAPLLAEEGKRFEARFGIPVAQGYGASEVGWIAGSNEAICRIGSVGKPLPYHDLRIVDDGGQALPPGKVGLVELGNDPGRSYRYVTEDGSIKVNAKGRIRTGDLGRLDDDGFLFITGREKDLIIRGGVNIAPVEIDQVLMQRPEIAEAATIGVPDKIYGEEVVSYVVVRPGEHITDAMLIAHCRKSLAAFKTPKRILFRDSLPKTARGKMDRNALIDDWKRQRVDLEAPTNPRG